MIGITLLQIEYFCAMARIQHFTKAAEALHISQSTLSYSIGELEKELGVSLFKRENKKIAITLEGEQFLNFAQEALRTLQKGKNTVMRTQAQAKGSVYVDFIEGLGTNLVRTAMEDFFSLYNPQSIVWHLKQASSTQITEDILSENADLGLTDLLSDAVDGEMICRQPLYVVCHREHRLAKKQSVRLQDLQGESLILPAEQHGMRRYIQSLLAENSVLYRMEVQAEDLVSSLHYVSQNMGISLSPQQPTAENFPVVWRTFESGLSRPIYLCWNKWRVKSKAVKLVRDHILGSRSAAFPWQ